MLQEKWPFDDARLKDLEEACRSSLRCMKYSSSGSEQEQLLTDSLDFTRDFYEELTGGPCACTIKMISDVNNTIDGHGTIRTYLRDRACPVSRYFSDIGLPQYSSVGNSAFSVLLTETSPPRSFYFENDLASCATYLNANPDWRKYYNACLVVAIRQPLAGVSDHRKIMGFLCVDNMHGGFNAANAKALVAFGYEMYEAMNESRKSMNRRCKTEF
jgi:hypothetical protein